MMKNLTLRGALRLVRKCGLRADEAAHLRYTDINLDKDCSQ